MANMVKTPDELMKILKAATMGDMCFTHILQFIEPGMTEKMVADEIEKTLLSYGAERLLRRYDPYHRDRTSERRTDQGL